MTPRNSAPAHSASSLKPILCFFGHMGARQGAGHHRYMQASTRDRLSQQTATRGSWGGGERIEMATGPICEDGRAQTQATPTPSPKSSSIRQSARNKNELRNLKRHLQLARRADPHIESARQPRATHAASCGRTCKPQHAKRILVRSRVSA